MKYRFGKDISLNLKRVRWEWREGLGPVLLLNFKNKRICFCFCHHLKNRSIKFLGIERYLCSRDLGIYFGSVLGGGVYLLNFRINYILLLFLMMPMIIDGTTQFIGLRKSNNRLRLLTGMLFGFSLVLLLGGVLFG